MFCAMKRMWNKISCDDFSKILAILMQKYYRNIVLMSFELVAWMVTGAASINQISVFA